MRAAHLTDEITWTRVRNRGFHAPDEYGAQESSF
jgi:hypothetical protein